MTSIIWTKNRFRVASLVVAALALTNSGCLLVAAGAAGGAAVGYAYSQGKVCQTYPASFQDTWAATQAALNDLGMPLLKWEQDTGRGFLESRTADQERVRIALAVAPSRFPAEGPLTRVGVRVATFGDHPVSVRILEQVSVHLAPPAGVPQPVPPLPTGVPQPSITPASSPPTIQPVGAPPQTRPPPLAPPEPIKIDKETGSR